ncbi:MAG: hypothetical protein ACYDH2_05940 [Anaerolineaceae bacterium]
MSKHDTKIHKKERIKGTKIIELNKKIDYLISMYGSSKELTRILNDKSKESNLKDSINVVKQKSKKFFISEETIKNWHKNDEPEAYISDNFAEQIPVFLGINKDIFLDYPADVFFKHLSSIMSSISDIFQSIRYNKSDISFLRSICGLHYAYYPALDGSNVICKALFNIYENNVLDYYRSMFSIKCFFKLENIELIYHGVVAYNEKKIYFLFENIDKIDGLSMIIANAPTPYKIHPFHGIFITTASLTPSLSPSSSVIYLKPQKIGREISDKDIEIYRQKDSGLGLCLSNDAISAMRKDIGEKGFAIIRSNLIGFVLQAKTQDTEDLRPSSVEFTTENLEKLS